MTQNTVPVTYSYQYWQHRTSGETIAVRLANGTLDRYTDPLHHREVTAANLSEMNYDNAGEDMSQDEQDAWRLVEPPYRGDLAD